MNAIHSYSLMKFISLETKLIQAVMITKFFLILEPLAIKLSIQKTLKDNLKNCSKFSFLMFIVMLIIFYRVVIYIE